MFMCIWLCYIDQEAKRLFAYVELKSTVSTKNQIHFVKFTILIFKVQYFLKSVVTSMNPAGRNVGTLFPAKPKYFCEVHDIDF